MSVRPVPLSSYGVPPGATVTKKGMDPLWWAVIVGGIFLLILVIIAAILIGYNIFKSSSDKLQKPVGEMNLVAGPYPDKNGIASASGHIDADLFKSDIPDLWGEFGYRAVKLDDPNILTNANVVKGTESDIVWSKLSNRLTIYDKNSRDTSETTGYKVGFTFWIPGQVSALRGDVTNNKIAYELVMRAWADATKNNQFKIADKQEIVIGRILSSPTGDQMEIMDSSDHTINPLLKTP